MFSVRIYLTYAKGVHLLEVFKPIDIKDADEHLCPAHRFAVLACQTLVQDRHNPFEEARVDEFGNRISNDRGLRAIQRGDDLLGARRDLLLDRPFLEVSKRNAQEPSRQLQG